MVSYICLCNQNTKIMQAKISKIFIAQQLQKGFATKKTFGPIELIKIGKNYYDEDGNWQSADFNA